MSPHNMETERYDFKSPHGIDHKWEPTVKLPESLGWTLNHILSALGTHNRRKPEDIIALRNVFIEAMRSNPLVASKAYYEFLPNVLLGTFLQAMLKRIPKTSHLKLLGRELSKLIRFHRHGVQVHSQEWKSINARLRTATELAANLEKAEHRSCLDFILKGMSFAATDETPATYANILREMVNASECLGDNAHTTYTMLAEKLLACMVRSVRYNAKYHQRDGYSPKPLTKPAVQLLRQLGTLSVVNQHSRAP